MLTLPKHNINPTHRGATGEEVAEHVIHNTATSAFMHTSEMFQPGEKKKQEEKQWVNRGSELLLLQRFL